MTYSIVESSPQAKAASAEKIKVKYPFDDISVGQSFLVPIADVTESSIRMAVSRRNKKDAGKFSVIKHGDPHNAYEVARIA